MNTLFKDTQTLVTAPHYCSSRLSIVAVEIDKYKNNVNNKKEKFDTEKYVGGSNPTDDKDHKPKRPIKRQNEPERNRSAVDTDRQSSDMCTDHDPPKVTNSSDTSKT